MKTVIAILLFVSVQSQAWIMPSEPVKPYSFKFQKFEGEVYEYETKATTQTEAFEKAAQACFEHFKAGRHISMDYGQDIIDICVNPRSNI